LPGLVLALALAAATQGAQAQSDEESGNVVATVVPGVTQSDRRALMASFVDRLGPSCLEKGDRFDADPAALSPTAWSRGFYRADDISETSGGTVGLEHHPDRHICAGLGFNYAKTDLALEAMPQSGELEAFSLGAYARRDGRLIFVDGAVAATYATIDSTRHFGGQTARGDTEATGAGIIAGIGLVLRPGSLVLEPRIGLDFDHNTQDGFTERGAGVNNLHIAGDRRDALRSNIGMRLHTIFDLPSGAGLMPEFTLAWAHNLLEPAVTIRERPVASHVSFPIGGAEAPKDFLLLGAGLSFHPNASDEIFVRYDGAWAEDDIHADAISAGGKLRF
jgi:outer membrane autotransporter protein